MNKQEVQRNVQRTTSQVKVLRELADKLEKIGDAGYYIEFFFDSMTVPYGAEVSVGVGIGDLTKPKATRILLRSNPGVWSVEKVLDELNVLVGEDKPKTKK